MRNPIHIFKDNLGLIVTIGAAAAVLGYAYRVPYRLETVEGKVKAIEDTLSANGAKLVVIEKGQENLARDLQTDRATFAKVAVNLDNMVAAWNDHLRNDVKRDMRVEGLEKLSEKVSQIGADLAREAIANNEFKLAVERDIARIQSGRKPQPQEQQ